MLCHFQNESVLDSVDFESVENGRDISFELDIYDCTDHLPKPRATCDICPFLAAVQKALRRPGLIKLRINIYQ